MFLITKTKNDVKNKKWWSQAKEVFLVQSDMNFLFFKSLSPLLSEKHLFPRPLSLLSWCCHRRQENNVTFQGCRLQGKNMLFPSSWRAKKKKKKKKKSNDLGSFDGKQMYRSGLTFRLDAKLLLQRLVCVGISSGKLALSFFSTLLPTPVHSALSTSSAAESARALQRDEWQATLPASDINWGTRTSGPHSDTEEWECTYITCCPKALSSCERRTGEKLEVLQHIVSRTLPRAFTLEWIASKF